MGGDNRIILDKGANERLCEKDIDAALSEAQAGDIYLTQLENPVDVIGYGLKKAREKGMFVILNPAPANAEISKYLGYCDLVIPNETELAILGGAEELSKKVKRLAVTLGGEGFGIYSDEKMRKYPCKKIKPVDTTGAGDTFCGGLCVGLSEGKTLEEAAKFGSKAATLACLKKGAQSSVPTRPEVDFADREERKT